MAIMNHTFFITKLNMCFIFKTVETMGGLWSQKIKKQIYNQLLLHEFGNT